VQSRVCSKVPIFTAAHIRSSSAGQDAPSLGAGHHTDDLARSLGLPAGRDARSKGESSPLPTCMQATPVTEVHPENHRNALDRKTLQRRQCWLWRERKHATGSASAPKLRQSRCKYSATSIVSLIVTIAHDGRKPKYCDNLRIKTQAEYSPRPTS
jgi:hypothetical protein